ncbi:probable aspartyl aminopeptidase isoform X3 [Physcomitrium patens]|uniref:Aspartyl aminopeptidase n=2 Tax=Physcomitrium patens TaxID=3218 RepID=A0A7I4FFG0_PHYPA|nr:probable aspartyl aminopeptidase isoform X2 [Physcomitrium patens]|eukprot:XP_024361340.1 probable aspartyl aminopeptidase isoform X2 [Physcomitrella patens]
MDEASRNPSFLIDIELWQKFNLELRAACHWCTHHHTTTPAEAAKQLERGEGWPRDWISRKVKNSTRQFGGLFICPAQDCAGHSNAKGERRRRWFCRFCINRHLSVDLKSFFQFDEVQCKWIQIPGLSCWHCQAKLGDAECINCPQKHTKRAKRAKENPLPPTRSLLGTPGHTNVAGVVSVLLAAAGDGDYDGVSSEGRGGPANEAHSMDESNFGVGETHVRLGLPMHASPVSDFRYAPPPLHQQHQQHQQQPPPPRGFFSEKGLMCREAQSNIIPHLLEYVDNSCTPFHATAEARKFLLTAGFQEISECEEWALQPGGRYFFTRNMCSIYAFAIGHKYKPGSGFHVIAAHTDSPCPKLKPVSYSAKGGFVHVRVQPYGAGVWQTWFDRDLSVAGRVLLRRKDGDLVNELVRVGRPILRIPTVANPVDRGLAADGSKVDAEVNLAPVLAMQIESELAMSCDSESSMPVEHNDHGSHIYPQPATAHHPLLIQVLADALKCDVSEVADFDLSVYDTQPACVGGARDDFVFAGRLDNLTSTFCALWALLHTCADPSSLVDESCVRMIALFDSGEVGGPDSAQAAGPQIMLQAMTRIARWLARGSDSEGVVERAMRRSLIVSADMVEGMYPIQVSSPGQEESFHHPKLRDGLVLRQDASNANDIVTSFLFREVAKRSSIPVQNFPVSRETGCCSTVSSILAAGYGLRLIDCGVPLLSMHSVREMCSTDDIETTFRHFREFFQHFTAIDEQLRVDV